MNYHLNKAIGDNETGFNGIEDVRYRSEAWDFMVAGGALYNNLDYSFTTDNEDGTFIVAPGQPGGGGAALRGQLKLLKQVFDEIDFIHMKPLNDIIKSTFEGTTTARVLAKEGNQYLLYLNNSIVKKSETNESDSEDVDLKSKDGRPIRKGLPLILLLNFRKGITVANGSIL